MLVVVPGTGWRRWPGMYRLDEGPMCNIAEAFGELPRLYEWNGKNWRGPRERAAEGLAEMIAGHEWGACERLNLVGFSHGGNIAIGATRLLEGVAVENLVTVATPVLERYRPGTCVRHHVNVYNPKDSIQRWGGEAMWLPFGGRLGWAQREFPGAVNVRVEGKGGSLTQRHGDLLWDQVLWAGLRGLLR